MSTGGVQSPELQQGRRKVVRLMRVSMTRWRDEGGEPAGKGMWAGPRPK